MLPTLEEFLEIHPEQRHNGRVLCECGASNIRTLDEPGSGKMWICAVCNKALFVEKQRIEESYEKNP